MQLVSAINSVATVTAVVNKAKLGRWAPGPSWTTEIVSGPLLHKETLKCSHQYCSFCLCVTRYRAAVHSAIGRYNAQDYVNGLGASANEKRLSLPFSWPVHTEWIRGAISSASSWLRRIRVRGNFAHKLFSEIIHGSPIGMHAHETHAYEIHAYEIHAYEIHVYKIHAYEMHAYGTYTHEMQAHTCLSLSQATPRPALVEFAFPGNHT
jgi:hypothetical protein